MSLFDSSINVFRLFWVFSAQATTASFTYYTCIVDGWFGVRVRLRIGTTQVSAKASAVASPSIHSELSVIYWLLYLLGFPNC